MNAERLNDLAALNAVGALEGAEAQELQQFLNGADDATKSEVARLNNVAGLIGATEPAPLRPSPGLKAKILARIERPAAARPNPRPFFNLLRNEGEWRSLPVPGVRVKTLSIDRQRGYAVNLYELAPGARFPEHHHSADEQCFVLSGDFHVQGHALHAGDFHHAGHGSDHGESFSEGGCQLLVIGAAEDCG